MKILVLPDIHGREFWKGACEDIDSFDKVIFLGDYFDPYDFEGISVATAIENFQEILDLKRYNIDKVLLLLGNHDLPYMFDEYYNLSNYHCRHSEEYHDEIGSLLRSNAHLFTLSCVVDDILFTHAGVRRQWFIETFHHETTDVHEIGRLINTLTDNIEGLRALYHIRNQTISLTFLALALLFTYNLINKRGGRNDDSHALSSRDRLLESLHFIQHTGCSTN